MGGIFALERFGAVDNLKARLPADELVMSRLVGILEPPPAADVQHQDRIKHPRGIDRVGQKLLQAGPML